MRFLLEMFSGALGFLLFLAIIWLVLGLYAMYIGVI
jgi:hypothetical protein